MTRLAPILWSTGAKALSLGCAALAVKFILESTREIALVWHDPKRSPLGITASIIFTALIALIAVAALAFIAWRLWRHWSSGTVRIVTGAAVGLAACFLLSLIIDRFPAKPPSAQRDWVV